MGTSGCSFNHEHQRLRHTLLLSGIELTLIVSKEYAVNSYFYMSKKKINSFWLHQGAYRAKCTSTDDFRER